MLTYQKHEERVLLHMYSKNFMDQAGLYVPFKALAFIH